jgi:hypothetical protein
LFLRLSIDAGDGNILLEDADRYSTKCPRESSVSKIDKLQLLSTGLAFPEMAYKNKEGSSEAVLNLVYLEHSERENSGSAAGKRRVA